MQDYGHLFTDVEYLTKKETSYKVNDPKAWSTVMEYRGLYALVLPLTIHKKESYLVLTPRILHKIMGLDQLFFHTYKLKVNVEKRNNDELKMFAYPENIKTYVDMLGCYMNVEKIETLLSYHLPVYSEAEKCVYRVESLLMHDNKGSFDMFEYEKILMGETSYKYRKTILEKSGEDVEKYMEDLQKWVEYKQTSGLIVAISSFFYFSYIKPSDKHSLLYARVFLRYALFKNGYDDLISFLPIEKYLSANHLKIEEAYENSVRTRDLTYFLMRMLKVFEAVLKDTCNYLEKQLQLLGEIGKENELEKILDCNPDLKEYQVNFYLKHRDEGVYYSINRFKEECHTSYETARISMDRLAELGFYKKKKSGKRFVYCAKEASKVG